MKKGRRDSVWLGSLIFHDIPVASLGLLGILLLIGAASIRAEPELAGPLAQVNGEIITAEFINEALGVKLTKLEEQIYQLKHRKLETVIEERLFAQEAAKRGISVATLLEAEVTGKVPPVTDAEVQAAYQKQQSQFFGKEESIRWKIRTTLQQQKLVAQRKRFLDVLRETAELEVFLQPPPVRRFRMSKDGVAVRGPGEAQVSVVEFSDFHCPFCKRVQPTLEKVLKEYPTQVKLVYRDFPLDNLHPQARRAAEAARCAHEQGKFWEYHDLLFSNAPKASSGDLESYAEQAGLEVKEFQACLSDGTQQAAVQQDVEEGARLGITGTPMFFINGRPLSGALPLDRFVQVIEEELAQAQVASEKAAPPS